MSFLDFYSLIPFGQTLMRVFKYDGSFDAPFLLIPIMQIFPWSLVSSYYISEFGLKKGSESPKINYNILIPIITKILLLFIIPFIGSSGLTSVIANILLLVAIFIMIKLESNDCTDNNITDIGIKTIIMHGLSGLLFHSLFTLFHYIPLVGDFVDIGLDISYNIPYIGPIIKGLIWSYLLIIVDMTLKMYNKEYNKSTCVNLVQPGYFKIGIFGICSGMVLYTFYEDIVNS